MKRLIIVLAITAVIFLVELTGGFLSNSLALISDAGHMLADILALSLALFAMIFSMRVATEKRTYGFHRLEILAALFNGSILVILAFYIFYEAYQRFLAPVPIKSGLMLTVAVVGFFANLIGVSILSRGSKADLNLRGAFLHVFSDMISSAGVITGGIIIFYTGWLVVDPILGLMIGILILRGAVGLAWESANILLEAVPKGIQVEKVVAEIKKIKGVKGLHHVHIWTITSGMNAVSAHVLIDDNLIEQTARILKEIREFLNKKYNIVHATFQTECESCPEGVICRVEPGEIHTHEI